MIHVALNGFGRIGRRLFRLLLNNNDIRIVAINDLSDAKTLSHLLKYDSIHGILDANIDFDAGHIIANQNKIPLLNNDHPKNINWHPYNVDVVIEATGKFKSEEDLIFHAHNGASKVVLSFPSIEDRIKTVVMGVNDHILTGKEILVSNASESSHKGIIEYTEDPIVSIDIVGNSHSCIFDAQMTSVIGNMVKIIGWYDNESGYSSRIIDLIYKISWPNFVE